jgi:hypothetical protein
MAEDETTDKKMTYEERGPMTALKLVAMIIKGGPWALFVIIVLAYMAAEFGFLPSKSAQLIKKVDDHMTQGEELVRKIEGNTRAIRQMTERSTEAYRRLCIAQARTTAQVGECANIR